MYLQRWLIMVVKKQNCNNVAMIIWSDCFWNIFLFIFLVNKQLADKERVAAALENMHLLNVINQCLAIKKWMCMEIRSKCVEDEDVSWFDRLHLWNPRTNITYAIVITNKPCLWNLWDLQAKQLVFYNQARYLIRTR